MFQLVLEPAAGSWLLEGSFVTGSNGSHGALTMRSAAATIKGQLPAAWAPGCIEAPLKSPTLQCGSLRPPAPALQLETEQVPVAQVAMAWGRAQGVLQLPQLERVLSAVSQPLVALLSQLPQPAPWPVAG